MQSESDGTSMDMTTKTAIIVDAACDLPADFIAQNHIYVLPFHIITLAGIMQDNRNPERTARMYQTHLLNQSEDFAKTEPFSTPEVEQFFLNHIVTKYDQALAITMTSSRSETFSNVKNACFGIMTKSFKPRREAGLKSMFQIELVDSTTLGPGIGILVYEALRLLKSQTNLPVIKHALDELAPKIYVYGLPDDLLYMYTRAKAKNENSITWGKYTLASMLGVKPLLQFHNKNSAPVAKVRGVFEGLTRVVEHLVRRSPSELNIHAINISFAGNIQEVMSLDSYKALNQYCQGHGIDLFMSQMALTIAVNLGSKALMIGFCANTSDLNEPI